MMMMGLRVVVSASLKEGYHLEEYNLKIIPENIHIINVCLVFIPTD